MTAAADPVDHRTASTGLRWLWSAVRLDFIGVAFATLFFCLSLTPSLLPRDWMFQGVICGINATIGYGIGVLFGKLGHRLVLRNRHWWSPSRRVLYLAKAVIVAVSVTVSLLMVIPAVAWQRQVSALMGITGPSMPGYLRTLIVAALVAAVLIGVSRLLLVLIKALAQWQIRRWNVNDEIAFFIGTAVVVVLLISLINGVLLRGFIAGAGQVFQPQNASTRTGVEQPLLPEKSGSPMSLAPWDTLGYQGRNFVGTGPDAAELTALNGRPAEEPIRIYAGLASADTTEGRLDVLLSEMQRTRVQERQLLVIIPTTGTGWVDPVAARAIESMYNGDTALVAMQYSYLPSWISFIADQQTSMDAGRAMVNAIHERWSQWPDEQRPELVLYGESLGSLAGQAAFEYLPDIVQMEFSAVLWVGPPNASPLWQAVTARRDPGTPQIAPRYDNGRTVRFSEAESPAQVAADTAAPWDGTRVLFLQHPSDPVVWWSADLLFERPDWLVEPPGYDRTASMRWYPIVTFWQVGFDIINASAMPAGHGHNYSDTQLDGWAAVIAPEGWTAADTERIRDSMDRAMAAGGPEFA